MSAKLRKTFTIVEQELKALLKSISETGKGTAQIAVIGVKDHDDDVMEPGCFGTGQWATVQPAHNWKHLPLGKALIREEAGKVYADFELNLDSQAGKEWHSWLKFDLNVGVPVQEWSWGFDPPKYHMGPDANGDQVRFFDAVTVVEVSPVLRGAGTDTGTVNMKSKGETVGAKHTTDTSHDLWNRTEQEERLKSDPDPEYLAKLYATGDRKFLHHFVDMDATPREASVKACLRGIDVLNGKCGGESVPEADRQGVYDHLANHLKDAGISSPPELKAVNSGMKFTDQMDFVLQSAYDLQDHVRDLGTRISEVKELREKSGRKLSTAKVEQVNEIISALKNLNGLEIAATQTNELMEAAFNLKAESIKLGLDLSS